jgi:FKBP-type peptidyl-prolyl cis-trans isomerase 2
MDSNNNQPVDTTRDQAPVAAAPAPASEQNAVIIGIVVVVLFLAAIAVGIYLSQKSASSLSSMNPSDISSNSGAIGNGIVANGDTIRVNYLGTLADGKVFDTSLEDEAKKANVYQTARTYEPLRFTVGQGQMIAGFDKAVVGMKVGETKTFTIPAKEAYGEKTIEEKVPRERLADNIVQEVSKDDLADRIVKTFPKTFFGTGTLVAGGKIKITDGMTADVVSVTDNDVTIAIENTESPFYGKPIKVGMTGSYQGNNITVKSETASGYLLSIENKTSPFYGKPLAVGLTGTAPDGTTLTVTALSDTDATIAVPNTHELAGKDLTFRVTIVSIDSAASTMPEFQSGSEASPSAASTGAAMTGATE